MTRRGRGLATAIVIIIGVLANCPGVAFAGDADTQYGQMSMTQIGNGMRTLADRYPEFVTYDTAQNKYGLPKTCSANNNDGCHNPFLIIEDKQIYNHGDGDGDVALRERPDVFLSGALHGDERVAPVALLEMATLLVEAAACQAGLGLHSATGYDCDDLKKTLLNDGDSPDDKRNVLAWLARLVSTRRIVLVPAPNSNGYNNGSRTEKGIDPNRDFSYDQNPNDCMESITARTINELFLDYLIQMSMTYHAGIENITYEWGAISIPSNKVSPDDTAQRVIAEKMAIYAGKLYNYNNGYDGYYENGDMNDILYPVKGGFEDWAYASSWEEEYSSAGSNFQTACTPNTYGGYAASKTQYDAVSFRSFNFLVETSSSKNPPSSQYGTNVGLLREGYGPIQYDNNKNNGYATKAIRIALTAIDVVNPYVEIVKFHKKNLPSDIMPLKPLQRENAKTKIWKRRNRTRSKPKKKRMVRWTVGGAVDVDETFLIYGSWEDFEKDFPTFGSVNQLDQDDINGAIQKAKDNSGNGDYFMSKGWGGQTRWTDPDAAGTSNIFFSAKIDLTPFQKGDKVAVFALAKVDQSWKTQPGNVWPTNVSTQSHIVNSRTDPDYRAEKTSGVSPRNIHGRLHWISVPLTIQIK
jgi:hypothetical protein